MYRHCGGAGFSGACDNYYIDFNTGEVKLKIRDVSTTDGNEIVFFKDNKSFSLNPVIESKDGDPYKYDRDEKGYIIKVSINDSVISMPNGPIESNTVKGGDFYRKNTFHTLALIGIEQDFSKIYFNFLVEDRNNQKLFNMDLKYSFKNDKLEFIPRQENSSEPKEVVKKFYDS